MVFTTFHDLFTTFHDFPSKMKGSRPILVDIFYDALVFTIFDDAPTVFTTFGDRLSRPHLGLIQIFTTFADMAPAVPF